MMSRLNRYLLFMLLVAAMVLVFASPGSACQMYVEPVEEGVVRVYLEGGRTPRTSEVVVYNESGEEIARGEIDENGYFHYPADQGNVHVVADDGMGHRAEWRTGDAPPGQGLPRLAKVALVVLGLLGVAALFNQRAKKGRNSGK